MPTTSIYAPVQLLSASRQNLWRLTLIRLLVLAAQGGSVGIAYLSGLVPLPWLALCITLGISWPCACSPPCACAGPGR